MIKKIIAVSIITLSFSNLAFALDTEALDLLLAKQDYKALIKQLNSNDPETLTYIRKNYMDWHEPLVAEFYAISFLIPLSHPEKNSTINNEDKAEVVSAWSRAKTILFVDRQDCVAFTDNVHYWTENFNIASEPMQSVLGNYPAAMFKFGTEALEWAKIKESGALRPPAVWLCGDGNIKSDSDRLRDRKKALTILETQLQGIRHETEKHN